jgi:sulfite reductase (ferredoxin)
MFAQRLGAFVEPERAAEAWAGVASLFREYGYRRSRNQARLKFRVKDWGPEEFRGVLEKEFLDGPLPDGPEPPTAPMHLRDHVGVHAQRDGLSFVGFVPRAGRTSGHQLRRVADLADRFGSGRIRTTPRQKLVILDVDPSRSAELVDRLEDLDLPARPASFRKGVIACTGIEFCKLAIGETKGRARWLAEELDRRLPGLDEEIRIHVNGCPNSCARFQVADIGLMSALERRPDGTRSEAFLVHLGGGTGANASFGRKVKGVRIFAEDAADYVETLVRRYRGRRGADSGGFTEFVRGLDDVELATFARPKETR